MYNNTTPPPYNGYTEVDTRGQSFVTKVSDVMKRVYFKMFLGLLVTAFVSLFVAGTPSVISYMVTHSWVYWGCLIAELGLVFAISGAVNKMSSATATLLFYAFSAVNGLSLAPIFIIYTMTSIAKTFFICAGTFGAMSIYGYFTTSDLTTWGKYLTYALFGLIIASVVNMFTKSSGFDWLLSIVGVLLFVGLTAWDTQNIKRMAEYAPSDRVGHLATIGALSLYLDFVNLFLYLLRFFGSQRD